MRKGSKLSPCPHCNQQEFLYSNVRAYGWCEAHFSANGEPRELVTEPGLHFTRSKTIYCSYCCRRRRDLTLNAAGSVVQKQSRGHADG